MLMFVRESEKLAIQPQNSVSGHYMAISARAADNFLPIAPLRALREIFFYFVVLFQNGDGDLAVAAQDVDADIGAVADEQQVHARVADAQAADLDLLQIFGQ